MRSDPQDIVYCSLRHPMLRMDDQKCDECSHGRFYECLACDEQRCISCAPADSNPEPEEDAVDVSAFTLSDADPIDLPLRENAEDPRPGDREEIPLPLDPPPGDDDEKHEDPENPPPPHPILNGPAIIRHLALVCRDDDDVDYVESYGYTGVNLGASAEYDDRYQLCETISVHYALHKLSDHSAAIYARHTHARTACHAVNNTFRRHGLREPMRIRTHNLARCKTMIVISFSINQQAIEAALARMGAGSRVIVVTSRFGHSGTINGRTYRSEGNQVTISGRSRSEQHYRGTQWIYDQRYWLNNIDDILVSEFQTRVGDLDLFLFTKQREAPNYSAESLHTVPDEFGHVTMDTSLGEWLEDKMPAFGRIWQWLPPRLRDWKPDSWQSRFFVHYPTFYKHCVRSGDVSVTRGNYLVHTAGVRDEVSKDPTYRRLLSLYPDVFETVPASTASAAFFKSRRQTSRDLRAAGGSALESIERSNEYWQNPRGWTWWEKALLALGGSAVLYFCGSKLTKLGLWASSKLVWRGFKNFVWTPLEWCVGGALKMPKAISLKAKPVLGAAAISPFLAQPTEDYAMLAIQTCVVAPVVESTLLRSIPAKFAYPVTWYLHMRYALGQRDMFAVLQEGMSLNPPPPDFISFWFGQATLRSWQAYISMSPIPVHMAWNCWAMFVNHLNAKYSPSATLGSRILAGMAFLMGAWCLYKRVTRSQDQSKRTRAIEAWDRYNLPYLTQTKGMISGTGDAIILPQKEAHPTLYKKKELNPEHIFEIQLAGGRGRYNVYDVYHAIPNDPPNPGSAVLLGTNALHYPPPSGPHSAITAVLVRRCNLVDVDPDPDVWESVTQQFSKILDTGRPLPTWTRDQYETWAKHYPPAKRAEALQVIEEHEKGAFPLPISGSSRVTLKNFLQFVKRKGANAFAKTDEVLLPKHYDGRLGIKSRLIVAFPMQVTVCTISAVKEATRKICELLDKPHVFADPFGRKPPRKFWFTYGVAKGFDKSKWANRAMCYAQMGITSFTCCGDDLLGCDPLTKPGTVVFPEADYTAFDSTIQETKLRAFHAILESAGAPKAIIKVLQLCCRLPISIRSRRKDCQFRAIFRGAHPALPSGLTSTSLAGTVLNFAICLIANFAGYTDQGWRDAGVIVKFELKPNLGSATFLAGGWHLFMDGLLKWLRHPGLLSKLYKVKASTFKPKHAKTYVYAFACCMGDLDPSIPILYEAQRAGYRIGEKGPKFEEILEQVKPYSGVSEASGPIDRERYVEWLHQRYGCTERDILEIESLYRQVETVGDWLEHPMLFRFRSVDYGG